MREIDPLELRQHATPDDAWVAIDGEVYDLTGFLAQHPGGPVMTTILGTDATARVAGSHLVDIGARLRTSAWRERMGVRLVGRLAPVQVLMGAGAHDQVVRYSTAREPFRVELDRRVRELLRQEGRSPFSVKGPLLTVAILVSAALTFWTLAFVHGHWWAAAGLGVTTALVGMRIGHPAMHGAFVRSPRLRALAGFTFDLFGGSSADWDSEHSNHHDNTNTEYDADLGHEPIFRMHPNQAWRPHYRYQHIYGPLLYSLVSLRWVISSTADTLRLRLSRGQRLAHLASRPFVILAFFVAPFWFLPLGHALLVSALYWVTLSYALTMVFSVTHTNLEVEHVRDLSGGLNWAESQVRGSANWRPESRVFNWLTGGLNHQIEHHLFPTLDVDLYWRIAPVVRQTCEEFGIPYRATATWRQLFWSHLGALKQLGERVVESSETEPDPEYAVASK